MKAIRTVICSKFISAAVQLKLCSGDTVCKTADGGPDMPAAGLIPMGIVMAEHHITHYAFSVRNCQTHQCSSVIRDSSPHAVRRLKNIESRRSAVFQLTES